MIGVEVRRTAVRLLMIDAEQHLLLLHYLTPDTAEEFWLTPGGAIDEGESAADAAAREAWEEVGVDLHRLGPAVWRREHRFRIGDGRLFVQQETFHLQRIECFTPRPRALSDFEDQAYRGHRWWSVEELRGEHEVALQPSNLGDLLAELLERGVPAAPIDIGAPAC